jgi:hypothetical protein
MVANRTFSTPWIDGTGRAVTLAVTAGEHHEPSSRIVKSFPDAFQLADDEH